MDVGWRVLEKSSLGCSGDSNGLNVFWATVKVEYLDLDIGDDIANISSSLPGSYCMIHVHVQSCDLWSFLFHILEIQKSLIFKR